MELHYQYQNILQDMKTLYLKKNVLSLSIDEKGKQFLEYLQSDECHELFKRNKITIHIETGHDNYTL